MRQGGMAEAPVPAAAVSKLRGSGERGGGKLDAKAARQAARRGGGRGGGGWRRFTSPLSPPPLILTGE